MSGAGGAPGGSDQIDLDMSPIMNILIILISFLVTMVVFTHIAMVKFSLPPEGAGGGGGGAPGKELTVVVSESGFQVMGGEERAEPLPRKEGRFDFPGLRLVMAGLKKAHPSQETVILLIAPSILYEDIIGAMDACRENGFPQVLLSGGAAP